MSDAKGRNEPSETPPRKVKEKKEGKKKKRRRNRKKKGKKFKLENVETNFMLVPKGGSPVEEVQPDPLPISVPNVPDPMTGGFVPLPFFPFGGPGGLLPPTPNIPPGMPMEIGGTTFFNSTAPTVFDPLSLLPSHDPVAIRNQVEWYFQEDNLNTDIFLRQSMDERGYVPVEIIANFNRLKAHGITKEEILTCCRPSKVVKVKGSKIKCRYLWFTWVLPGDKVTSVEASDDEEEEEELVAAATAAPVPAVVPTPVLPDLTQTTATPFTNVFTANEFFNIFRQPQPTSTASATAV